MATEPKKYPLGTGRGGEPPGDDPVARVILDLVEALPPGRSLSPVAAARAFALERARPGEPPIVAWRRFLPAVKQQALHLARQGRIRILRKGKEVDPAAPVKGVIRLAPAEAPDPGPPRS